MSLPSPDEPEVLRFADVSHDDVIRSLREVFGDTLIPVYASSTGVFPGGKGPYLPTSTVSERKASEVFSIMFGPQGQNPPLYVYQLAGEEVDRFASSFPVPDLGPGRAGSRFSRALWVGSRRNVTPAHTDGLVANLLMQLVGRKRFWLWAPSSASELGLRRYGEPHSRQLVSASPTPFRSSAVLSGSLEPGQCLYIPPGWIHEIESVDPSVSISSFFGRREAEVTLHTLLEQVARLDTEERDLMLHLLGWPTEILDEVDPTDWSHAGDRLSERASRRARRPGTARRPVSGP